MLSKIYCFFAATFICVTSSYAEHWHKGYIIDSAGMVITGELSASNFQDFFSLPDTVLFRRSGKDQPQILKTCNIRGFGVRGFYFKSMWLKRIVTPHLRSYRSSIHGVHEFAEKLDAEQKKEEGWYFACELIASEFTSLYYSRDKEEHFYIKYDSSYTGAQELEYHYLLLNPAAGTGFCSFEYQNQLKSLAECGCYDGAGAVMSLADAAPFEQSAIVGIVKKANDGRRGIKFFPDSKYTIGVAKMVY